MLIILAKAQNSIQNIDVETQPIQIQKPLQITSFHEKPFHDEIVVFSNV